MSSPKAAARLKTILAILAAAGLSLPAASADAAPEPPVILSTGSSAITPFQAHLEGIVNPENELTNCQFQYGPTPSYGTSVPCEPATLEGVGEQGVGGSITGLSSATPYHFRLVLENASGETTAGPDQELTTLTAQAPTLEGESATVISTTDAKLEAQVNPNYQETTVAFEYATEEAALGTPAALTISAGAPLPAGVGAQPVGPLDLGDALAPETTYFYRALATNATGTTPGATQTFTTFSIPLVLTGAPQQITRTAATLTGSVNPNGAQTSFHYTYIDDTGYKAALAQAATNPYADGASTPEAIIASDSTVHATDAIVVGELTPATTYHYAVLATNTQGVTVTGPDVTFTTAPATPPVASTGQATGVGPYSATLTGTVDTRGLQTAITFEFGSTPALGSTEPATVTSESGSTVTVGSEIAGWLLPAASYYYRTVATSADGTSYGAILAFTTAPSTVLAGPAQAFPDLTAFLPLAEQPPTPGHAPTPSRAHRLARALRACARRPPRRRPACRRHALKRYGPVKPTRRRRR